MVRLNSTTIAMCYELQQLRHEYKKLIDMDRNKEFCETGEYAIIETVPNTNGQINFILRGSEVSLKDFGDFLGFDTDQRSFRRTKAHKFQDYTLTTSPEKVEMHSMENPKLRGEKKPELFMFENTMPIKTDEKFEAGYHILHRCEAYKLHSNYKVEFFAEIFSAKLPLNMKQSNLQSKIDLLTNSIMLVSGQARQYPMQLTPTLQSRTTKRKAPTSIRPNKRRRYGN